MCLGAAEIAYFILKSWCFESVWIGVLKEITNTLYTHFQNRMSNISNGSFKTLHPVCFLVGRPNLPTRPPMQLAMATKLKMFFLNPEILPWIPLPRHRSHPIIPPLPILLSSAMLMMVIIRLVSLHTAEDVLLPGNPSWHHCCRVLHLTLVGLPWPLMVMPFFKK
jgi:hypothetical protein